MRIGAVVWLSLAAAILLLPVRVRGAQQVLTVATRPGVSVRVLLRTPDAPARGTLLLFPGGNGAGHFTVSGGTVLRTSGNFLVRSSPLVVEQGFTAAIVDAPSDQARGMSDQFRASREHAEDVRKVLDAVAAQSPGPIYLTGTSRGTISVAHLAATLEDRRVEGLILTATIGVQGLGRLSLWQIPLDRISMPVLFVHHRHDGCDQSPFGQAVQLRSRLTRSPRTNFIEVLGGDPPLSDPCEGGSAHGFLGKEREVVAAIVDWIQGKPVPERIGP